MPLEVAEAEASEEEEALRIRATTVIFICGLALPSVGWRVAAYLGDHGSQPDTTEWRGPFARAGEWVTHPDGTHVCRLTVDLTQFMVMQKSYCTDWVQPAPYYGQQVDWLRQHQINIEGQWRP